MFIYIRGKCYSGIHMDKNEGPLHKPPAGTEEPRYVVDSKKPTDTPPEQNSIWREILSTVGILVTALVVAFLIIGFVFRSYQVDGPSMRETLQNNDKLIIWKVPKTWSMVTRHSYVPARGDVIVFTQSGLSEFGQQDTKQLIKRVIGLPGDRVTVQNGAYKIYNSEHPQGFNPDQTLHLTHVVEPTTGNTDYRLASDELFVSGDNRPDSLDSRAFGPIHPNQIVGKLVLRVFPINQTKTF
jgi:signal peptidase I